jgi:signal peptidase I
MASQSAPRLGDAAAPTAAAGNEAGEEPGADPKGTDPLQWTSPSRRGRGKRRWLDALAALALVAAIVYLHLEVVRVAFIGEGSMLPAISPGDRVVVSLSAYHTRPPRHGDVVAFRCDAEGGYLVKRVIGVGGDELTVGWGMVLRNGKALDEPYVDQAMFPEDPVRVVLGEGQLFVLGDSRNGSEDSRDYGVVSGSQVLGRVCWRILPLGRAGPIR